MRRQVGFGSVGSALSGRKYTWGNALGDAATGCVFGALDPMAFGGELGEAAGAVERGLGEAGDAGEAGAEGAAASRFNPFAGKSAPEIDQMFRDKGFEPRGPNPESGEGGYVNPKTGRSYHVDPENRFGEPPHVDVNRPRGYRGNLEKRKFLY